MFGVGMSFARYASGDPWEEVYQIASDDLSRIDDQEQVTVQHPGCAGVEELSVDDSAWYAENGSFEVSTPVLRQRAWRWHVYLSIGVVLGNQAAAGFGPGGHVPVGWLNAPHAVEATAHAGWAARAPWSQAATGRVQPLLDVDLYVGAQVPFGRFALLGRVLPVAGIATSVGTTF